MEMSALTRVQLLRLRHNWQAWQRNPKEWGRMAIEFKRRAMIENYEYCQREARNYE